MIIVEEDLLDELSDSKGKNEEERIKRIHCFDDVRAIIFLEGLAGYNQGYKPLRSPNIIYYYFYKYSLVRIYYIFICAFCRTPLVI